MFEKVLGKENYFTAACLLEKGSAFMKMNKLEEARDFLDQSKEVFQAVFPPNNGVYVKLLNYEIEYHSFKDDNQSLMSESVKLIELSEEIYETKTD